MSADIKVIKFSAKWCGPCRKMATDYNALISQAIYSQIEFSNVDIDESPDDATDYNITSLPTVVVTADGKEIGRHIGANITSIRALLDSAVLF